MFISVYWKSLQSTSGLIKQNLHLSVVQLWSYFCHYEGKLLSFKHL